MVASVMPGREWNPLLQPELDGSHVKQTQLKYRRSRCHKTQHSLKSFERTGGTFLEGGRVALNCHGSLLDDSCCHLQSITVPRNKTRWLGNSMLLEKLTFSPRQSKWLRRVLCDDKTACDWARMSQSSR